MRSLVVILIFVILFFAAQISQIKAEDVTYILYPMDGYDGYVEATDPENPRCNHAFAPVYQFIGNDESQWGLKFDLESQCFHDYNLDESAMISAKLRLRKYNWTGNPEIKVCGGDWWESETCPGWTWDNFSDYVNCGDITDPYGHWEGDWRVYDVTEKVRQWCIHGNEPTKDHGKFMVFTEVASVDNFASFYTSHFYDENYWPYLEVEVSYDLADPTNLICVLHNWEEPDDRDTYIDLYWSDNSEDEHGFEIWRKEVDAGMSWEVVDTAGRQAEHYWDTKLAHRKYYYYKIRALRICPENTYFSEFSNEVVCGPTPVDQDDNNSLPLQFRLLGNSPNPFNATTDISYCLPHPSEVELTVYNLSGHRVTTLLEEFQPARYHTATWDASALSSGIYFYRLTAGEYTEVKRMTLLK